MDRERSLAGAGPILMHEAQENYKGSPSVAVNLIAVSGGLAGETALIDTQKHRMVWGDGRDKPSTLNADPPSRPYQFDVSERLTSRPDP